MDNSLNPQTQHLPNVSVPTELRNPENLALSHSESWVGLVVASCLFSYEEGQLIISHLDFVLEKLEASTHILSLIPPSLNNQLSL